MNPASPASVLAVIPARFGATRFPGKPLAVLWGKPLVRHVWERACAVRGVDRLVIATDDVRIAEAARGFGAEVAMTSPECASGTDRAAEVARVHPEAEIVVNLQGDEPELDADAVSAMIAGMRADRAIRMATLAHPESDPAQLASPNVVKVEVGADGDALGFTRRDVPARTAGVERLRHVGVYAFDRATLFAFASWPPSASEREERLEQLRALDHGVRIRVFRCEATGMGVDTPEQLEALERRGPRG